MGRCSVCGRGTHGSYRKCYSCNKKSKSGWVYGGISTRMNGSRKVYTGETGRTVRKRWGEHIGEVKKRNSKTWVGKGDHFQPIGSFWSSNRKKAERTMKKKSQEEKLAIFNKAARKHKKKRRWFSLFR